jgi:Helix-turn-helix of insertion element transposase
MTTEAIQKRQDANKKLVLEQLKKTPIVELVCDRCGIGRTTYYDWRNSDPEFKAQSDEAMKYGKDIINDLSESQLITLIKEKNFPAIQLWLRQHHPEYSNRVDVRATIEKEDPMTPEQEALIRKVLGIKEPVLLQEPLTENQNA